MCRWIEQSLTLVLAAALALATAHVAVGDDEVASFLERHGLTDLLAVHLETEVESTEGEQRDELIMRLAGVYSMLLETEVDAERKRSLEQRSRRLLTLVPAAGAEELRLALLRAAYRTIERVAENHRLRLASAEELDRTKKSLADVTADLNGLGRALERSVEQSERRLSRASGPDVATYNDALNRYRGLLSQCRFLNAWALYYDAYLTGREQRAGEAEQLFTELLLTESSYPQPTDVSVDMRGDEGFARCILGMALCKSITASSATALSWVELLEHERTVSKLREQVPAWKLMIHLAAGEFPSALEVLTRLREDDEETPLPWLRLAAVHGLERQQDAAARELVRFTVTQLAARGELQQVYDLATRYGVSAMGDTGFALRYINGLLVYQDAREMHGEDEPAVDEVIRAKYAEATDHLQRALNESDTERYEAAAASCRMLVAWSLYFQGKLLDARESFLVAAKVLPPDQAAEALWMSIVSLDRLIAAGGGERLQSEREALVERYLDEYPGTRHAARLTVNRAMSTETLTELQLEDLLAIPPDSDVYALARLRASQGLYRLFRHSRGERKIERGRTFLTVAAPLMVRPEAFGKPDDPGHANRWSIHLRRVLEVALTEGIDRGDAARDALLLIEDLVERERLDVSLFMDELEYRQLQFRLLSDDLDKAAEFADRIWERDYRSIWSRLSSRALYTRARRELDSAAEFGPVERSILNHVVVYGGRVLREFEDDPDAPTDARVAVIYSNVADASLRLLLQFEDEDRGRAALFLYRTLLVHHPRNTTFLRRAAVLAERFEEATFALECWRRLLAGHAVGSDAWFEARVRSIELLANADAERARAVLEQHTLIHPDYGPEPWGSRLRAIERELQGDEPPADREPDAEDSEAEDDVSPSEESSDDPDEANGPQRGESR